MIEPTAEEFSKINAFGERVQLAGFTWSIYKAKPDTPRELSRWDVKIEHTAYATHFGFGQATRLAVAIVQACECLERLVLQQYGDNLERAPCSREIKQMLSESKRLLPSKLDELSAARVRRN